MKKDNFLIKTEMPDSFSRKYELLWYQYSCISFPVLALYFSNILQLEPLASLALTVNCNMSVFVFSSHIQAPRGACPASLLIGIYILQCRNEWQGREEGMELYVSKLLCL